MTQVEDADEWFVDLGVIGRRIELNEKRAHRNLRQNRVLAAFLLLSFLLLAWRSELNADRIDRTQIALAAEQKRLEQTRIESCLRGVVIIGKFNRHNDRLAAIERRNPSPDIRDELILAYEEARILPLPACPPMNDPSQEARP